MRKPLLLAALGLGVAGTVAAVAVAGPSDGPRHGRGFGPMISFEELDTDGDGSVTQAEFVDAVLAKMRERLDRRFDRIDADGDGVVTAEEFEAAREAMRERWHRHRDGAPGGAWDAAPDAAPETGEDTGAETPDAGP